MSPKVGDLDSVSFNALETFIRHCECHPGMLGERDGSKGEKVCTFADQKWIIIFFLGRGESGNIVKPHRAVTRAHEAFCKTIK